MTRVRTALEGSRGFTMGGRLSLTPSVEVGLRVTAATPRRARAWTSAAGSPSPMRSRGCLSLSFAWDPTPSSPLGLGLTVRVAPSWGGSAQGGAEALWSTQMALRHGLAPDVRLRRAAQRGGGLRVAGGRPLRRDAKGRDLSTARQGAAQGIPGGMP